MKKQIKSQKVYFKGIDQNGNEKFSWLGEESTYNLNGDVLSHRKFDEEGNVFESGENTYEGDKLVKEIYDCPDEGTSMTTTFDFDEKGNQTKITVDYGSYLEIQKFSYEEDVDTIVYEDEEGELEKTVKIWRNAAGLVIKEIEEDETGEQVEFKEYEYDNTGKVIKEVGDGYAIHFEYNSNGDQVKGILETPSGENEIMFTREYDDQGRLVKAVEPNSRRAEFKYEGDDYMSQTIYDLERGGIIASITEFYTENDIPVKTVSTHNVRSYIVDSMAAMRANVVSYEYHFENEFYD